MQTKVRMKAAATLTLSLCARGLGRSGPSGFYLHCSWTLSIQLRSGSQLPRQDREGQVRAQADLGRESWEPGESCLPRALTHSLCTARAGCSWRGRSPACRRRCPARSAPSTGSAPPHRCRGRCSQVAGSGAYAHTPQWTHFGDSATCCPRCKGTVFEEKLWC